MVSENKSNRMKRDTTQFYVRKLLKFRNNHTRSGLSQYASLWKEPIVFLTGPKPITTVPKISLGNAEASFKIRSLIL